MPKLDELLKCQCERCKRYRKLLEILDHHNIQGDDRFFLLEAFDSENQDVWHRDND